MKKILLVSWALILVLTMGTAVFANDLNGRGGAWLAGVNATMEVEYDWVFYSEGLTRCFADRTTASLDTRGTGFYVSGTAEFDPLAFAGFYGTVSGHPTFRVDFGDEPATASQGSEPMEEYDMTASAGYILGGYNFGPITLGAGAVSMEQSLACSETVEDLAARCLDPEELFYMDGSVTGRGMAIGAFTTQELGDGWSLFGLALYAPSVDITESEPEYVPLAAQDSPEDINGSIMGLEIGASKQVTELFAIEAGYRSFRMSASEEIMNNHVSVGAVPRHYAWPEITEFDRSFSIDGAYVGIKATF